MNTEEELRLKLGKAKRLMIVADAHLRLYFYDPGSDELLQEKAGSEWAAAMDIVSKAMWACIEEPETVKHVGGELSGVFAAAQAFDRSLGSALGAMLRGLEPIEEE
jgi:hypothetical protein